MSFKELSSLPYQEGSNAAENGRIIRDLIRFEWQGDQTWCGHTPEELTNITIAIANFLGYKPEDTQKLGILFADHNVEIVRGEPHYNTATCYTYYDHDCRVRHCDVVFNRSLEILKCRFRDAQKFRLAKAQQHRAAGVIHDDPKADYKLRSRFESEEELLIWIIAEELHHAHVKFLSRSKQDLECWQANYHYFLSRANLSFYEPYSTDLLEVAASRVVLRLLSHLSADPLRAQYFHLLYEESLDRTCHVAPVIINGVFVETGFREPGLVQKLYFHLSYKYPQLSNLFKS